MSVLHIGWNGDIGGAERAVHQLVVSQHVSGRRRVALGFGQARGPYCDLARSEGVRVLDFAMAGGSDVLAALHARQALRAFDIHHFHAAEPLLMLASTSCRSALRIYTHRAGLVDYHGRSAARYRLVRPLVRRFDAVTGTAQAAAAAERWLDVPAARVVRTFNGIDFARLDAAAELSRDELRAKHGVAPDAVLIGTAANLRRWKRIDWLIEAAGRLRSDDWRIWIIGDGEDRARLQQLADRSGVGQRIQFHDMQDAIAGWLRALDVFVLPSGPEESFGNAVIEAMACGVAPIVSRDCPAHREHVADGRTGLVVDDPAQLATRLDDLIAGAAQRTRLGSAARQFVRETYPIERMVERFELLYDRLESSRRSA
jgi:glycosyltransferase involved in cell wall biosynthesis